jgi:hypothetical protein
MTGPIAPRRKWIVRKEMQSRQLKRCKTAERKTLTQIKALDSNARFRGAER